MTVPGCSPLLQALKAEAASESSLLFGICGGIEYDLCVEVLAKSDNSAWRHSVRTEMQRVHQHHGAETTRLLVICLGAGVDAMTKKRYGAQYWRAIFQKDRPDAAGVTPVAPRRFGRQLVAIDTSREPVPLLPIDPQMLSCHSKGGSWDPVSGKCVVTGPDFPEEDSLVEGEANVEGECAAAGGVWDPATQMCLLPEPEPSKAGLYLALGGLGIVALAAGGVYLALRK
jgi:hypothetical protein